MGQLRQTNSGDEKEKEKTTEANSNMQARERNKPKIVSTIQNSGCTRLKRYAHPYGKRKIENGPAFSLKTKPPEPQEAANCGRKLAETGSTNGERFLPRFCHAKGRIRSPKSYQRTLRSHKNQESAC